MVKRWLLAAGVTVLFLLPKGQGMDVGKLQPVELLYIYIEEGAVAVRTDTGEYGRALTLSGALRDMKRSAAKEVFLETVDYILVTESTRQYLPQLMEYTRPGTAVVLATGEVLPEADAEFLRTHKPKVRLCECIVGQTELPKLMTAGERKYLVQREYQ